MKDYVVLIDSVGDLSDDLKQKEEFVLVPLTMNIMGEEIVADYNVETKTLLEKIKASPDCPKTACPAPGVFLSLFEEYKDKRIYVVTVSNKLSGSYNSAKMAKEMFMDDNEDANIVVLDSLSASAGQGLICELIYKLEEEGKTFAEVCDDANRLIENIHTVFVLEDLTFLEKNGRLTGVTRVLSKTLHICPILHGPDGEIMMLDKAIGPIRAINKMIDIIVKDLKDNNIKTLQISHCDFLERAIKVKDKLLEACPNLEIIISHTGPCATLYAGYKGIVVSY